MKNAHANRCSNYTKTKLELSAELSGYQELIVRRIKEGWRAYLVTIQMPETNLTGPKLVEKIKRGADMFMAVATSQLTNTSQLIPDRRPIAVFVPDRRDGRSKKLGPTKISPANEGVHLHGIVLVHPQGRVQKLVRDFLNNKGRYECGSKLRVHIVRIDETPQKAFGYAFKGIAKRYYSTDDIIVFPLAKAELATDRVSESGPVERTKIKRKFLESTMSAISAVAEKMKSKKVPAEEFLALVYYAAFRLEEKYGLRAGALARDWVVHHKKAGDSIPRFTTPTVNVVLGAGYFAIKTRSKYARAIAYISSKSSSELTREQFMQQLKLCGGFSGAATRGSAPLHKHVKCSEQIDEQPWQTPPIAKPKPIPFTFRFTPKKTEPA